MGYNDGMTGTMPAGNAYAFSGVAFGWLYSWPASLLARRPLLVSLNAGQCKCL